jgi:cyclohexadienyl dehydratase
VDDVRARLDFFDRQHGDASLPDSLDSIRDPIRVELGPAGGTPIADLGFHGDLRGCQKLRKSRRLEDGPEPVKPARRRRWSGRLAALAGAFGLATAPASAEPVLRVGTSGDYAPFSRRASASAQPEGFDVVVLRAWARERGREIAFVPLRWPELLEALAAGRFDVAASGITVRPERSAAGRFTTALAETQALALARGGAEEPSQAALDRPEVRIAVNAGGHLERVARASFPHATLVAVPDNDAVIEQLAAGVVDAVVTDAAEAPQWEARVAAPLARVGPLSRDRKAWLVQPERGDLAADFDAWLLAREADGSLAKWRAQWLGPGSAATAAPLAALLGAIDERLALMPLVAAAKRRDGVPLVVPEREKLVVERALADVRAEAARIGREPPPENRVRALFEVQLEAARRVQRRAASDPPPEAVPDLERALRPALLRIGERITRLLLALPPKLDAGAVRAAADDALRAPYVEGAERDAIAAAIAVLTRD